MKTFREIDKEIRQLRQESKAREREQIALAKELYKEARGYKVARGFKDSAEYRYVRQLAERRERYYQEKEVRLKFGPSKPEPIKPTKAASTANQRREAAREKRESQVERKFERAERSGEVMELTEGGAPFWTVHDVAKEELDRGTIKAVRVSDESGKVHYFKLPEDQFRLSELLASIKREQQRRATEARTAARRAAKAAGKEGGGGGGDTEQQYSTGQASIIVAPDGSELLDIGFQFM